MDRRGYPSTNYLTYLRNAPDDVDVLLFFDRLCDAMTYAQMEANARDRSVFMCSDTESFFEMEFKPRYTFKGYAR
jgi:hypothetical protein